MKILAIESSCDETSAAIVEDGKNVLSNIISSQIKLHEITEGVVPEIAARAHIPKIIPVIDEALKTAKIKKEELDAIAITVCPGLLSALLVGAVTGELMAYVLNKPLIPVHHIAGHIYSTQLMNFFDFNFPRLYLTVSGGHNELILMREHLNFEILGSTLDDAAGEAFDKAARLLNLGYPGGPKIEAAAKKHLKSAEDNLITLPRPMINSDNLNMSFSGLKTALYYLIKNILEKKKGKFLKLIDDEKNKLAYLFQDSVTDVLTKKVEIALEKFPEIKEVHLVGGVSANTSLREKLAALCKKISIPFYYPKQMTFCTDNAGMIASAAFFQIQKWPGKYIGEQKLKIFASKQISEFYC